MRSVVTDSIILVSLLPAFDDYNSGLCHRFLWSRNIDWIENRFSHFEKKMLVYNMVLVELFKVKLTADPVHLPVWITVEEYEEVKELLQ